MTDNTIKLPGVLNTRELGTYPAAEGRHIKKGVLIRSGVLSNAEPEAAEILSSKYHLQMIIDLRMSSVRDGSPDKEVPGAECIRLPVVEMEDYFTLAKDPEQAKQYMSGITDQRSMVDFAYESGLLSPEMYILFLLGNRGKKAYAEFFRILIDSDPSKGAVLWHCVDGKDRAGLATMLLLTALGTDKQTILEDYMLSNSGKEAKLDKIRKDCESLGMPPEKIESLLFVSGGVFKHYMVYAMDTLDKRYGSINGYLAKEIGLTQADIDILREKYTEA